MLCIPEQLSHIHALVLNTLKAAKVQLCIYTNLLLALALSERCIPSCLHLKKHPCLLRPFVLRINNDTLNVSLDLFFLGARRRCGSDGGLIIALL